MEILIKNSGKTVSYDEIGFKIWGEDFANKFSLEAISQLVARLRKKLSKKGVIVNSIQCVQGKGYILSNNTTINN